MYTVKPTTSLAHVMHENTHRCTVLLLPRSHAGYVTPLRASSSTHVVVLSDHISIIPHLMAFYTRMLEILLCYGDTQE